MVKNTLGKLKKIVLGHKTEIKTRVFRSATGKWENEKVVVKSCSGGLLEPIRILLRTIFFKKTKYKHKGRRR